MAANYGLLGEMASGIKEGLIAYQTTQNIKRQNQQFNLLHGVQGYDKNEAPIFTPEEQAKRQAGLVKSEYETASYDPTSSQSLAAANFAKMNGMQMPEGENALSGSQLKEYLPFASATVKGNMLADIAGAQIKNKIDLKGMEGSQDLQKIDAQGKNQLTLEQQRAQTMKDLAEIKRKQALEVEALRGKTKRSGLLNRPEKPLSEGIKQKLGFIQSINRNLDNLDTYFDEGLTPSYVNKDTPLIGRFMSDDPVTISIRQAAENYGRLQSGGAVNKDEEARFMKMLPDAADSREIRKQKLAAIKAEVEGKKDLYMNKPDVGGGLIKKKTDSTPQVDPKQMTREEKIRLLRGN